MWVGSASQQITFDAMEVESGEVWRGRVWQPDRQRFRRWLARRGSASRRAAGGDGGGGLHGLALRGRGDQRRRVRGAVAEPAERRPRGDASVAPRPIGPTPGCCGSCWSRRSAGVVDPADAVLEWRERIRLYKTLVDQRTGGCSGSTPSCTSTAWPCPRRRSARRDPGPVAVSDEVSVSPAARQRIGSATR